MRERRVPFAAAAVLVALAAVLAWAVGRSERLPRGPEPVAWSRVACARCGMLVGEPAYAAQLQESDGTVHHFDDPGCLLLWAEETPHEFHAAYFHHAREERWLPRADVRFAPAPPGPMQYGLGAVDASDPEALSYEQAVDLVRSREALRRLQGS